MKAIRTMRHMHAAILLLSLIVTSWALSVKSTMAENRATNRIHHTAEVNASNTGSDVSALHFVPHKIDTYRCESCNFGDFNNDGQLDIISGERLYLAPDFNPRVIRTIKTEGLEFLKEGGVRRYDLDKVGGDGNGYLDIFMDEPLDIDQDGWLDVVSSGWFNEKISWYRNPEGKAGIWEEHIISSEMGNHETGEIYDIDGDGIVAEVMPFSWSTIWFELEANANGKVEKRVYTIEDKRHPFLGGGVGDVNGDGHPDIIRSQAWFEAPEDPRDESSWIKHQHNIGGPGGTAEQVSLVEVYDVDEDGFNDLVTSSAHNYGVFWYKQIRKGREISWEQHSIDDSWTQAQAVRLADMDGDGDKDLVTGKRFMAHNGADPESDKPLAVYWYELKRGEKELWEKHVISFGQKIGVGMNIPVSDFDGDGDLDFVVNGKWGGPVWFENRIERRETDAFPNWESVSDNLYKIIPDYDKSVFYDGISGPGSIYVSPYNGDLYVSMHNTNYGVYRSSDQGRSFVRVDQKMKSGRHWAQFAFDAGNDKDRMAVFSIGPMEQEPKSCLTYDGWKTVLSIPGPEGLQKHDGWTYGVVDWSEHLPKTFFAKEHHANNLWLTKDGGKNWQMILHEDGFPEVRMVRPMGIASGGALLISKYEGILRSVDDGKNWDRVSDYTPVACLPVHFAGNIYWAAREGVIMSDEHGLSWKLIGQTKEMVSYGPYFGETEQSYIIITSEGFLKTKNGGQSFERIAYFPSGIPFDPIIFDEAEGYKESFGWDWQNNILYANRRSGQLYKLSLK